MLEGVRILLVGGVGIASNLPVMTSVSLERESRDAESIVHLLSVSKNLTPYSEVSIVDCC